MVLNTTKLGGDKLSHEIFYWQGKESTQASLLKALINDPPSPCQEAAASAAGDQRE